VFQEGNSYTNRDRCAADQRVVGNSCEPAQTKPCSHGAPCARVGAVRTLGIDRILLCKDDALAGPLLVGAGEGTSWGLGGASVRPLKRFRGLLGVPFGMLSGLVLKRFGPVVHVSIA
jgi:hypothetical protein